MIKTKNPRLISVAVEPKASPVLSGGSPGPHKIQGIGAGFVPANLNRDIIDKVVPVSEDQAFKGAKNWHKLTACCAASLQAPIFMQPN